jgi:hypothetical protein
MNLPPPGAPASLPAGAFLDAIPVPARMPALPGFMGIMQFQEEPDLNKSAQRDMEETPPQFPPSSFSSLPSVGRTEENEEHRRGV